jgi:3-dehydroquinate synthase
MQQTITFPSGTVNYLFNTSIDEIAALSNGRQVVVVMDSNVALLHKARFEKYNVLIIPSGEQSKALSTIETLTEGLLKTSAGRDTLLVGVGGGVVTDIVGLLGTIYMRGVSFGLVPTTLLGMVDAAVGGKNGVNLGLHKNIVGTITQPEFILFDTSFLKTLPHEEWSNGFAEIIKYACIFDAEMFDNLACNSLGYYQQNEDAFLTLIEKCVAWKNKTVLEDERETAIRKLLNFGHTFGHAIENMHGIPHGHAVAIGMVMACKISEEVTGLDKGITEQLKTILKKYGLPVQIETDYAKAMEILRMDKKRTGDTINYILLQSIGKAIIKPLPFSVIENTLSQL